MSKNYNFFKFKSYFLLVSLLFFSKAFSTNWYVNDNSTTGDFYCTAIGSNTNNGTSQATPKLTLGAAITAASPGDTIFIDTGTYSGTGNINLTVAKANLTFTGAGSLKTIFDNNFASANTNYWLNITANNININGISGTEFNAVSTGKVVTINGQTVTFNDVVFFNNSSNGNGAIYITSNSNVTYSNSNNTCNAQFLFGGGIDVLGDNCIVNITNCIIATNRKADNGNGGGLYVRGLGNNVTVTNTRFEQNDAVNGGAICVVGGKIATPNTLTINGSCFNNNKASQVSSTVLGGAVSILRGAATVNITDSSFTNNQAGSGSMTGRGGAILINTNTDVIVSGSGLSGTGNVALNLEKCSFSNNNATSGGKHIYADEGTGREIVVNINQCTFASVGNFDIAQNTPTEAVFIFFYSGSPTVSNLSLSNTTAPTQTAVTVCQPFTGDGCSLPAPCTASLSYPNSSICSSASTQTPTFSPIGGTFTSTTGLSINASTGVITPSSSTAGTYTITYTPNSADPTCKATFSITIVAAPVQPTIACYQTATFNTTTCSWDVTGTQPVQPTTACYQTATFNTTTCSWDVTGTQPAQPTTACYQTATWNPTSCQYDITGTQPTTPTVLCYQTATWNPTSCQYDITGTQPTAPTVLCYQTATWNPTSCQYDITGTQQAAPTIGQINQPSCLSSVGIFQINAFDSNYIYSFIPAVINISSTGLVTANPGTYTLTMINNLGCASQTSANIVVNQQPSLVAPLITVNNAICNGSTYSVSFNTNGTISASTGTISGNIITGIAVGTNVVLSATSLNGCATTNMTVTSPASCITPRGCVTPTLSAGQGVCSGIGTYSFAFNVSDNATITSSAGTISGNTVINIPIGVVVTLTAIDGLCSTSLQINSPSNCSTPCASPVVSFSAGICNGNTYSINISNPNNAIITSSVGTVTTNAIIGIPTGTSVMITSVISGCSPQVITILSPNKIAPLLIISNAICNGSTYSVEYTSNGNVTSTFGSVNGDSITDIPIGTNIILIATSLNGCATTSMTVVSPTNCSNPPSNCIMPTLSAGQGTCSGTGTYSFAFNASAGAAVSVSSGTIIGNTVTGITVGTNVTLTATNGSCVTSLVVNSPTDCSTPCATPVVSFSAGICNGTTYSINISNPNAATITASAGNVTATNISNIPVGTNVIITSLTAGCSAQIISVFSSQLAVTPFAGNDGNLTVCENVTPTNAELFNALGGIPHNGGTWSNSGNVYTYTVQANSACSSIPFHSATVTINETIINNFAITGECVNENYQLSVSPIQNGVTYNWYDSNDTLLGTGTSIIINDNGTYHVESNLTNCKKIATITIENSNCIIPKGISPNGDGLNDSWNLSNLNIEKAQIFNRYGMEMFSKSNYTSEWHGQTNSGHILPSATYYYVLTLPGGMVRTGWVYLNREN